MAASQPSGGGEVETRRVGRWYFGGVASAMAASVTHPLDLIKVHLQTQQEGKIGVIGMGSKVMKTEGILGLYNGLSASVGRQLTYSMTRFAVYETVKDQLEQRGLPMAFHTKVLVAASAGAVGGVIGTPCDMVNVRMQNDVKLAKELRRNYKHVFDGLFQVATKEGPMMLLNGAQMASYRAGLITVGQLAFYDQIKSLLCSKLDFPDSLSTHLTASLLAGTIATGMTQPFDVMKTRTMNAKAGQYSGMMDVVRDVGKAGPSGFFKGFLPAFTRLGPHTILIFVFFEQLRLRFGRVEAIH